MPSRSRLRGLGADDELIADCLGVEPEAVAPLLDIARAKLARIREIDLRGDSAEHDREETNTP